MASAIDQTASCGNTNHPPMEIAAKLVRMTLRRRMGLGERPKSSNA
jgi:hypothetical protein